MTEHDQNTHDTDQTDQTTTPEDTMTTAQPPADATTPPTTTENPPETSEVATGDLPDEHLACLSCGVAVPMPEDTDRPTVAVMPMGTDTPAGMRVWHSPLEFTTCDACAERTERAHETAARFPRLAAQYGPDNATYRLASAFDGLAAIGRPIPEEVDEETARALIRTLSTPGSAARWVQRFVPLVTSSTSTAATRPWSHVSDEESHELRTAAGRFMAYRVARTYPDVQVRPPRNTGCMMCGVEAVSVPATWVALAGGPDTVRDQLWTERGGVQAANLGAKRNGHERVDGYTCPPCSEAIDHAGAIGQGAMSRSLSGHLKATGAQVRPLGLGEQYDDLKAHAVTGAPPNAERWAHVRVV